jgi:hypothetical protein
MAQKRKTGLNADQMATMAAVRPNHEVVPYRVYVRDDGITASIHGAAPRQMERWHIEQRGWTTFNSLTNQYGTGRAPFKTREEAEAFAASLGPCSSIGIGD